MKKVLFFIIFLLSFLINSIESSCRCNSGKCSGCGPKYDGNSCSSATNCKPTLPPTKTTTKTTTTIRTTSSTTSTRTTVSTLSSNSIYSSQSVSVSTTALTTSIDSTVSTTQPTTVPLVSTTIFYDLYQPYQIDFNDPAYLNDLMAYLDQDVTPCLTNCSSNGVCMLDVSLQVLICSCDEFFTGPKCNIDTRPCSNSPCLNNGTCTNTNLTTAGYTCECNEFYTGSNCETQIDLCQNETCSSNGKCSVVDNKPNCTCFQYYSGDHCQTQSQTLLTIKNVIGITSVIAIIMIIAFYLIIAFSDLLNCLFCKKKRNKENYQVHRRVFKPFYVA